MLKLVAGLVAGATLLTVGAGGSAAHGCHGNGHGAQHGHSNHE